MRVVGFEIIPHKYRKGIKIVKIILDGKTVAVIYPEESGIKIVSAHFDKIEKDEGRSKYPQIPSLEITFKLRRYAIDLLTGEIIYSE